MRFKSFAVRSRPHRASRNSLNPHPPSTSLPVEANQRFASGVNTPHCDSGDAADVETVPNTFDTTRGGGLDLEACIACGVSDEGVSRCAGTGCIVWFHGECLDAYCGSSGSTEDLAKTHCPYCWYKIVVIRHESAREKAVEAEKNVFKYLSKDHSADVTDVVRGQDSDRSREAEEIPLTEGRDYHPPQEDSEKIQDAEEDKDEETTKDQTEVDTGAGGKGDVSGCSSSGKEKDQIQLNERPIRRIRQLILDDTDSDISSDESTNERNGKDVSEKNQHSSTTKVRDTSSVKSDQRKRLFWTPEEEEMLKVGVEKFSAESRKNTPWRKILEMGEEVFHETRTPADLKDKWRNRTGARGKKTN